MIQYYKYKNDTELKKVLKSIEIIIDSREQQNKNITDWFDKKKINYRVEKLNHGDYSYCLPANEEFGIIRDQYFTKDIAVERKAHLDELASNLNSDRKRLETEFALYKGKMHFVIEGNTYADLVNGNYRGEYRPISFWGTIHSFVERYNLYLVFIPNKEHTAHYIYSKFYYHLREKLKK